MAIAEVYVLSYYTQKKLGNNS